MGKLHHNGPPLFYFRLTTTFTISAYHH